MNLFALVVSMYIVLQIPAVAPHATTGSEIQHRGCRGARRIERTHRRCKNFYSSWRWLGSFTIDNVAQGDYRISVAGLPPDYYIKEARLGGTDILQNGFSITRPQSERLEILVSPNGAQIEGDIVDEHGDPVRGVQAVLVPDRDRDRRDLFRIAATDQNGHFTMNGLSPGVYKMFAWEELEPLAYFDLEILRRYELQAKSVTVSESSKPNVQVKVIPAEQ